MAVARRQAKAVTLTNAYQNAIDGSFTTPIAAGSTLLALFSGGGSLGAIASVTDDNGNTWLRLDQTYNDIASAIFVCKNANAGATHVYGQSDGGYYLLSMTLVEITGADAANPIAQVVKTTATDYLNAYNISLTVAAATRVLAFLATSNIATYTGSYSTADVIDADSPDYTGAVSGGKDVTAAGSTTVGFDLSGYNRGTLYAVEFKPAAATTPAQTITASTIADGSGLGSPTLTRGAAPTQTVTAGTVGDQSAVGSHSFANGVPPAQSITSVGAIPAPSPALGSPTMTAPIPSQSIGVGTIQDASAVSTGGQVFDPLANQPASSALDLFDNVIDPTMWASFGDVAIVDMKLRLAKAAGNNYLGLRSQRSYVLYDSFAYMQLVDAGDQSQPTWEVTPIMLSNEGDTRRVYITISSGLIIAWLLVDGNYQVQSKTPYDPVKHRWFRIREAAGTLYWETSRVGVDWQNLAAISTPSPYYFDLSALHVQIQTGDYTPTSPANVALVDNLNPPITDKQTITVNIQSIDAPVMYTQDTAILDDQFKYIFAGGAGDKSGVGTPVVFTPLKLTPAPFIDYSVVNAPTVVGSLGANDTAPSYGYFRRTFLPLRDITAGISISFQRGYSANAKFFIVGTSALNSGDVFQGNGSTIQEFDKFNYTDYAQFINKVQYHAEQDIVGSMVMAYADVELQNRGDLFSPYGSSPIANLILPNRPLKIYAGFKNENMQVFVGQTERLPDVTKQTASFHAKDFIKSFADNSVVSGRFYVGKRTDQIIADILTNDAGLSSTQYTLDVGLNTISFMYIAPDTKIGDVLRKLCEAEQGRLYQDNLGRMIFKNRNNKKRATALRISRDMVLAEKDPQAANVRNRVTITSDVRTVQPSQQVYPALQDGQTDAYDDFQSFKVPAKTTVEKFFNLKNPVTSYTHPTWGGANGKANSAQDGTGTDKSSQITMTVAAAFTDSVKYTFYNNDTVDVYVTVLRILGTPAPITDQIRIDQSDTASIAKYGEQLLEIKNDNFTSSTFAASVAANIITNLKEATLTREITLRGIPYMAVGDVVRYYDGYDYVVDVISGQISASEGNKQDIRLRRV